MGTASIFKRLKIALAFAALGSMVFTSIGAAQTTSTSETAGQAVGPLVVRVTTPSAGSRVAGTVTFSGVAVDCGRGVAANRVAVYDGAEMTSATYLADASIDTTRGLASYCSGRTDSAQVGWTLIYNSRQLPDGPHTLTFSATFPGGATTAATLDVIVDNLAPRYNRYNAYGRYYDNYYGSGSGYNSSSSGYYNNYYNSYTNNCYSYSGYGYAPGSCGGGYSGGGYNCLTVYQCPTNYGGYYGGSSCSGGYAIPSNCGYSTTYPGGYYNSGYYNPYYNSGYYNPYYNSGSNNTNNNYTITNAYPNSSYPNSGYPSNSYGCGYPYYAYYGYYNSCNFAYGNSTITLHQAGQNVRVGQPSTLSGFATCGTGSATSVSVYDRSFGGQTLIGTSTPGSGTYSVVWSPTPPLGSHTIQVVAQGSCGTYSQIFSVVVTN